MFWSNWKQIFIDGGFACSFHFNVVLNRSVELFDMDA